MTSKSPYMDEFFYQIFGKILHLFLSRNVTIASAISISSKIPSWKLIDLTYTQYHFEWTNCETFYQMPWKLRVFEFFYVWTKRAWHTIIINVMRLKHTRSRLLVVYLHYFLLYLDFRVICNIFQTDLSIFVVNFYNNADD